MCANPHAQLSVFTSYFPVAPYANHLTHTLWAGIKYSHTLQSSPTPPETTTFRPFVRAVKFLVRRVQLGKVFSASNYLVGVVRWVYIPCPRPVSIALSRCTVIPRTTTIAAANIARKWNKIGGCEQFLRANGQIKFTSPSARRRNRMGLLLLRWHGTKWGGTTTTTHKNLEWSDAYLIGRCVLPPSWVF